MMMLVLRNVLTTLSVFGHRWTTSASFRWNVYVVPSVVRGSVSPPLVLLSWPTSSDWQIGRTLNLLYLPWMTV